MATYGQLNADNLTSSTGGVISPNITSLRNRIINGAMVIDQRNSGASVAVTGNTGQMAVDRFLLTVFGSGTGRFTAQQSTTVPVGFYNSLSATVTTADSSPSSAYAYSIAQIIEGLNVLDLGWGTSNASTVTLSFWVRSSVTGTFPIVITNNNLDRTYGATYTINSANTFQYITITIPGDTTGTWAKNNTAGINIQFGLGGGSSRTVSTGWQANAGATTQTNVTGCTQLIATNGATFYLTGVQLEVGTQATSFDYRPYTTELQLCQRYYWKNIFTVGVGPYTVSSTSNGSNIGIYIPNPVYMRASPTTATSISNSNYDSSGPTSGNWVLNQPYTQNATKTGTVVVNSIGDATGVFFSFTGATFSVQPTGINGNGVYISASSEL